MQAGFEEDDGVAHAGGLDGGDDTCGSSAIDADIDLDLAGGGEGGGDERDSCECRTEASGQACWEHGGIMVDLSQAQSAKRAAGREGTRERECGRRESCGRVTS